SRIYNIFVIFFFQAEDGIRDRNVTGVQTCALPISTQVHVSYRNRYGRRRSYYTEYEGVIPWVRRRHAEVESDHTRERLEGYMRSVPCPSCAGTRLKPVVLAVTVGGKSIAEVASMSLAESAKFLHELELSERDVVIASQ